MEYDTKEVSCGCYGMIDGVVCMQHESGTRQRKQLRGCVSDKMVTVIKAGYVDEDGDGDGTEDRGHGARAALGTHAN